MVEKREAAYTEHAEGKNNVEPTIKSAGPEDVDAVYAVIRACSDQLVAQGMTNWTRYTKEKIQHLLETGTLSVLLDGEKIIGTIQVSVEAPAYYSKEDMAKWNEPTGKAVYFTALGVLPEYQNKGYGSKLIGAAEAYAKTHGIPYLRMTMLAANKPLIQYYLNRGFSIKQTRFVDELQLELAFGEKDLGAEDHESR